jgi:uncharacterized coiled-coil protein SlyX
MGGQAIGKLVVVAALFGLTGTAIGQAVLRPTQPTAVNANVPAAAKALDVATLNRFVALEARVKALETTVASQQSTIVAQATINNQLNARIASLAPQFTKISADMLKMKMTFNGHKHYMEGAYELPLHVFYVSDGKLRIQDDPAGTKTRFLMQGIVRLAAKLASNRVGYLRPGGDRPPGPAPDKLRAAARARFR